MIGIIVLLPLFAIIASAHDQIKYPIVSTPLGLIKGSILQTVLGKPIYAFRGIPYAIPPINELRFQPPQPIKGWTNVYDATEDGAICPQPGINNTSEDCLYLNVYTSVVLQTSNSNPNRPVLVFIHPGGYYASSGISKSYGPDYLLDQDLVLVTLNYRLGALGLLSTGDKLAPGNNGLKDQVIALRWVKQNIASFGGNPDLVTLVGYSSGGSSVSLHLVSPMSKGLFHRAMIMSGSSFGNWPVPNHQFKLSQEQARILNCPDTDSATILACLKNKSATEIADSLIQFEDFPIAVWLPVIEPDFGQERFLTDNPVKLILRGEFANVPVITSVTADEIDFVAWGLVNNMTWLREMDKNFEKIAPIVFIYERDSENSYHISRELRKFYLGNGPLSEQSLPQLGKLYSDGVVGFSVNRAAKLLAAKNSEPTYYYKMSYQGRFSFHYRQNTTQPEGVVHQDDLLYIFYISRFPRLSIADHEYKTVQKLTTMIKNFALYGKPITILNSELDNTEWNAITPENNVYLDIGKKMVMKKDLYEDRYAVWARLIPLPNI